MTMSMDKSQTYTPADLDRLAEELNRDGICVIPGLLPRPLVEAWAQAFFQLFTARQQVPGGLAPREQARYYLTLPMMPPFADPQVWAHPVIRGVLDRVFGPDYVMVQLGADVPLRGSDYQETHRDHPPLFGDDVVTPLYALAVNVPLVDVTEENGPFQMARGTHILPRDEGLRRVEAGEIPLETFPSHLGDVIIRTPLALHRGTPNRTDTPRPVAVIGYVRPWLNTTNVDLTVPRALYESWPEDIQRLLRCQVVEALPDSAAETYVNFKF